MGNTQEKCWMKWKKKENVLLEEELEEIQNPSLPRPMSLEISASNVLLCCDNILDNFRVNCTVPTNYSIIIDKPGYVVIDENNCRSEVTDYELKCIMLIKYKRWKGMKYKRKDTLYVMISFGDLFDECVFEYDFGRYQVMFRYLDEAIDIGYEII